MSRDERSLKKTTYNNRNAGVTMVELVVSFALLALFLATAAMCISHAIIFFYHEKQEMAAYSVADLALSELRDDIRTMQGADYNGYVKLRKKAGDKLVPVTATPANGTPITGTTIEFVASNVQDAALALQIDTEGCGGTSENGIFSGAALINDEKALKKGAEIKGINKEHITLRYYKKYPETAAALLDYRMLYMDKLVAGGDAESLYSSLAGGSLAAGTPVVWHTLEKLSSTSYQDFKAGLVFSVIPELEQVDPGDGSLVNMYRIRFVDVTVNVYAPADPDYPYSDPVYTKKSRVELVNKVYYNTEETMYTDK